MQKKSVIITFTCFNIFYSRTSLFFYYYNSIFYLYHYRKIGLSRRNSKHTIEENPRPFNDKLVLFPIILFLSLITMGDKILLSLITRDRLFLVMNAKFCHSKIKGTKYYLSPIHLYFVTNNIPTIAIIP